jgi:HlyD family secretion protein
MDLADRTFPFRPGMNASADIKTKRVENVLTIPIGAVNARVRGSDESMADKQAKQKERQEEEEELPVPPSSMDELELVVFVLQKEGTVKKRIVQTGIQDLNYIEILSGLQPGEEVVSEPYSAVSKILKDGMEVKVVPKEELFEN